jgi:hypothetical protein
MSARLLPRCRAYWKKDVFVLNPSAILTRMRGALEELSAALAHVALGGGDAVMMWPCVVGVR